MTKEVYVKIEFSKEGMIKLTKENGLFHVYKGHRVEEVKGVYFKDESSLKDLVSSLFTTRPASSQARKGSKMKIFLKDLKKIAVGALTQNCNNKKCLYLEINKIPRYVKVLYTKELHDRVVEAHNYQSEFSRYHHSNFS